MEDIHVDPAHLEKLAQRQDDAASEAAGAASAANGTGTWCWVNHGVISGASNTAFGGAEAARSAVGDAIKQAAVDLAAFIRTAEVAYTGVDEDLSKNLAQQVLPK